MRNGTVRRKRWRGSFERFARNFRVSRIERRSDGSPIVFFLGYRKNKSRPLFTRTSSVKPQRFVAAVAKVFAHITRPHKSFRLAPGPETDSSRDVGYLEKYAILFRLNARPVVLRAIIVLTPLVRFAENASFCERKTWNSSIHFVVTRLVRRPGLGWRIDESEDEQNDFTPTCNVYFQNVRVRFDHRCWSRACWEICAEIENFVSTIEIACVHLFCRKSRSIERPRYAIFNYDRFCKEVTTKKPRIQQCFGQEQSHFRQTLKNPSQLRPIRPNIYSIHVRSLWT